MSKPGNDIGCYLAFLTVFFNFWISSAILFFSGLPIPTDIMIVLGMMFLLAALGQVLNVLVAEIHPINKPPVITGDKKHSVGFAQANGGEPTYSGFTDYNLQAVYVFVIAPALNIWLTLELISCLRA